MFFLEPVVFLTVSVDFLTVRRQKWLNWGIYQDIQVDIQDNAPLLAGNCQGTVNKKGLNCL